MAKIRLTNSNRDYLRGLFNETVKCDAEEKALAKTYAKAVPAVLKAVNAKYPAADMAVLKKYDLASADSCIQIMLTAGGVVRFEFSEADAPMTAKTSCYNRMYQVDDRGTALVQAWEAAKDAHIAARKQKRADYEALIVASVYLEEVETVWPEASALRAKLVSNLPATLTEDALSRIRADVAARAKAA